MKKSNESDNKFSKLDTIYINNFNDLKEIIIKCKSKLDFINFLKENSYDIIFNSKKFDEKWYLNNYADVKSHDFDAIHHYIMIGYLEGCNPNTNFNSLKYMEKKPVVNKIGLNPFVHFIISQELDWSIINYVFKNPKLKNILIQGIESILEQNLFDEQWYLNAYPDIKSSQVNPLTHFITRGYLENRNPSTFFDTKFYIETYDDVVKSGLNPLIHYALYGIKEKRICLRNKSTSSTTTDFASQNYQESTDIISKGKEEIIRLNLFDSDWYLNRYPDVKSHGIDPFTHYLKNGAKEGRWPSVSFDTNYYVDNYPDVAKSGLNPLIHYALYGIKENRNVIANQDVFKKNEFNYFSSNQIDNIVQSLNKKISIIIPIFNAYDDVKKCIDSILINTKNSNYDIILINDKSTDSRIAPLLNEFEKKESNIKVITNSINKGFVKSVNIGMKNTSNDVVLLNSDTEVTYNWLQKLIINAYSDKKIGTVTAVSNSAGVFSVPKMNYNEIPPYLTVDGMAKLVEKSSKHVNMEVPTGNGFCLFIKRETISDVGYFDEMNFGKGYGEENDFCMRALKKGWKNIIDDSTYIFHKESASFSSRKEELKKRNNKILLKMHPDYSNKVRKFIESSTLNFIETNVQNALDNINNDLNKKRILYVLHEDYRNLCGTGYTNLDLIEKLTDDFEIYILTSDTLELTLWKKNINSIDKIKSWKIKWDANKFYDTKFRDIYFNILYSLNIDLIQFDHLVKQTFDLPKLANILGIPSVLIFHDFYYICPSINLLDKDLNYCNAKCKDSYDCNAVGLFKNLPKLQDYLKTWRTEVSKLFSYISTFVSPTYFTMDLYKSIYNELESKNTLTIYHGRDFESNNIKFLKPIQYKQNKRPVKILVPGNIVAHKGAHFIKKIKENDIENNIEFHFMGKIDPTLRNCGIFHGKYDRDKFKEIVGKIKPSFIGIFSIWPETFCHVLSEAWDCKIPVIATNLGALKERIGKTEGGILVNFQSPKEAYNSIMKIINNPSQYDVLLENIDKINLKSTSEMANDYKKLYYQYLDNSKKYLNSIGEFNKTVELDDFKDFNEFLSMSSIDPLLRYPFSKSEEEIFKLMDTISNNLISNVTPENSPLVSIIMPTYNRAKVILNAIRSVLNQTYENFELIIVDDGSKDNTLNILESLHNDKLKIVKSVLNKGASYARNLGLNHSNGKYIFYLDSDNDWHPNYLKAMVGAFLELPDADAIYSGQYLFKEFDDTAPFAMRFGSFNKSMLKNCNYIDINCFAHKKEVYNKIGGFDENLKRYVDWDYIMQIDSDFNIYSVPIILSNYYHFSADNRISDVIDLKQTIEDISNNISKYNYLNSNNSNILTKEITDDLNIVIMNFDILTELKNSIENILNLKIPNLKITIMANKFISSDMNNYLNDLVSKKSNFNLIYYEKISDFLKELRFLNNANMLILDVKAKINEPSLKLLNYYSDNLEKCGILVPQQIIHKNNKYIPKFMPYSNINFNCDINLSKYNSNIINLPLYHNGKVKELSKAPFFCIYLKKGCLNNINTNTNINSFYELGLFLSNYIKYILNFKIYYIAEAEVERINMQKHGENNLEEVQ